MELSGEIRRFLEESALAALCLPVDLDKGMEAVLAVKASGDLIQGLRDAAAGIDLGWVVESTARGPVVCLALRARAEGVGDLLTEVFFDVVDQRDAELLGYLEHQESLRTVFLDEELRVAWSPTVPWDELRRLEAAQARDRAEELAERCEECDFDAARELFQEQHGLDGLEIRAFAR